MVLSSKINRPLQKRSNTLTISSMHEINSQNVTLAAFAFDDYGAMGALDKTLSEI